VTDAKTIPDTSLALLEGVRLLVINGLQWTDHFSHLSIGDTLELIGRLRVPAVYLTHLNHMALHAEAEQAAAARSATLNHATMVRVAHDGLVLNPPLASP
jgi:phosphoribosyl 1,2-cyclic phosphate phosphodiesterase